MFGALKLWGMKRKLRGSLASDPLQVTWKAWLDGAASLTHLRTSCGQPGWMVHVAYWDGIPMDKILEAALLLAQLAIEHGPPNVIHETNVLDMRQRTFPEVAATIVDIQKRYPAARGIESMLPAQNENGLLHLFEARGAANLKMPESFDLAKAGVAGAAAAGFSLALQAVFHRHYGARESLTLVTAGAASLFYVAMPDNRADLLATLRDRFGWQHSMTNTSFTK